MAAASSHGRFSGRLEERPGGLPIAEYWMPLWEDVRVGADLRWARYFCWSI